ncbi:PPOX class F420-dependent oxidoreductase [Halobacteriales archaeon QS_8_69_26]|nr:MAG: PPOX class F420-dependent oxidoreductase [Halobacteriales archaeon QS_8_69_26]
MATIPESFHDLFERETFAVFGTLMPAGTPQLTPVWIDRESVDGEDRVLVNTARGRQKERNVTSDPKVGVCVMDPDDPYRYVSVRGEVTEVTEDGAVEHIDRLARRYMDVEEYPHHGEESGPRVVIRIRPDRVTTSG